MSARLETFFCLSKNLSQTWDSSINKITLSEVVIVHKMEIALLTPIYLLPLNYY